MTRDQLIDAIVTYSGAKPRPGSRSRARLSALDDGALVAMQKELEGAELYGRDLNAKRLGSSDRLGELLMASESAAQTWQSAVENWSPQIATKVGDGTTPTRGVVPITHDAKLQQHAGGAERPDHAAKLARHLIDLVVYRLSAGSPNTGILNNVRAGLDKPIADLLEIKMLKLVTEVSGLVVDHVHERGMIGYFNGDAVAESREKGLTLGKLRYYPAPEQVSSVAVRNGLARATVCVRELAPTLVVPGPNSAAFGQFLNVTFHRYGRFQQTHHSKPSILVAMESADDPKEVERVIHLTSEEYPGIPVRSLCLFGTPEVSQRRDTIPVWTMVSTSGEPMDAPWDSSGGFELTEESMVFGAHTGQPFEVQIHDFERRLQTLEEEVGE
jgi:hypothetical protein